MQAWTEDELLRFAPQARDVYVRALIDGWQEIMVAGINTPARLCSFIAVCGHETGGLTIIAENTSWSAKRMCEIWPTRFKTPFDPRIVACGNDPRKKANLAYAGRKDLGNRGGDDGWLYRGRGFFQDTGRDTYREYGNIIGCDLEEAPDLLENPSISLRVALARWQKLTLNRFADRGYQRAIDNAINRGNPYSSYEPIGADSRNSWYRRAWLVFGDQPTPPISADLALGAHGARVEAVQRRLRELGYGVGKIDKVLGPTAARSIAAFKLDHRRRTKGELEPDEVVGPLTLAALEVSPPAEVSMERREATAKELREAGSSEVAVGDRQKTAGTAVVAVSGVEAARQTGMLDAAKEVATPIAEIKTAIEPGMEALKWGLQHAFWVVPLIFGIWVWSGGHKIIAARLKAHVSGFNLWR